MSNSSNATLTCHSGTREVTGSNFHLSFKDMGFNLLVDCGLLQGPSGEDENSKPFTFDPQEIDVLVVTHAHLDHIGRIPKLVRDGFGGKIISTPPTKDMARLMLEDALKVMQYRARADKKKGREIHEPFFDENDIDATLARWETLAYYEPRTLDSDVTLVLKNAGHILGSAVALVTHNSSTIAFTGDLGNGETALLPKSDDAAGAKYLVTESVYGNRVHEKVGERSERLRGVLERTLERGGTAIIPAFSIERTQIILYELNELIEGNKIPRVPVFLDAPLATAITEVYKRYSDYFNKKTKEDIAGGDSIFSFPGLTITETVEESKTINGVSGPKIILAGSGMSVGGRVIHHEKHYLSDPKSTLILVGFQVPGSLGRKLLDGAKDVTIFGKKTPVRAEVTSIFGYSAHADREDLLDFVERSGESLEEVFVVAGELVASTFFAQRIRDFLDTKATVPEKDRSIKLHF